MTGRVQDLRSADVAAAYDPFHSPMLDDPYPFFAAVRASAPVFHSELIDAWVVSRYDDVLEVFKHPELFSAENATSPVRAFDPQAIQILSQGGWKHRSVFSSDPPYHTQFRTNVHKVFTPRRVAELEPFVRQTVESEVDRFQPARQGDLVQELLYRLPAKVIVKLLSLPDDNLDLIKQGARTRTLMMFGLLPHDRQVEEARHLVEAWQYAYGLVQSRLKRPGDDLISDVLRIRGTDDSVMTLDEVTSLLLTFFSAGHETTSDLLGNAFRRLLTDRTTWAAICEEPSLIASAVDECIRFDTSIVAWRRRAREDVEIGGVPIPKGSNLLLLLGSANRDETVFEDAERFDIRRVQPRRPMSFGHGIHYCLGAPLAKIEIATTIEILSRRLPDLRLQEGARLDYLPTLLLRGPLSLPVAW